MSDENSPEKKDSQEQKVDWEKRFKDTQSSFTKQQQELSELKREAQKNKELLDVVSQYVDWSRVTDGTPQNQAQELDDADPVTRLEQKFDALNRDIRVERTLTSFRTAHPDMVPYEDLVTSFMHKTDKRLRPETRLEEAVELTKKFLDSERARGREEALKAKQEIEAREAEAGGLEPGQTQVKEPGQEEEKYEDYIKSRKNAHLAARGVT